MHTQQDGEYDTFTGLEAGVTPSPETFTLMPPATRASPPPPTEQELSYSPAHPQGQPTRPGALQNPRPTHLLPRAKPSAHGDPRLEWKRWVGGGGLSLATASCPCPSLSISSSQEWPGGPAGCGQAEGTGTFCNLTARGPPPKASSPPSQWGLGRHSRTPSPQLLPSSCPAAGQRQPPGQPPAKPHSGPDSDVSPNSKGTPGVPLFPTPAALGQHLFRRPGGPQPGSPAQVCHAQLCDLAQATSPL
ncbi:basic salivary proline-rich protein 2-like [Marmota marmota marmota]|uniref:basic salivary proline-rich protein 2-like n=1 Tax=Marmota marmota marmota TaxID=9994 RepID=UPI0020937A5D|nr:basic salivary proline-rich protein 2-like [Marmota marmota marmota]